MTSYETIRAALLRIGDITPAGRVDAIDYHGGLRRLSVTIAGQTYSRGFDELVDRQRSAGDYSPRNLCVSVDSNTVRGP